MRRKHFLLSIVLSVLLSFSLVISVQADSTIWTKTYGGPKIDTASDVDQTPDGGYILGGNSQSFATLLPDVDTSGNVPPDIWLVKIDKFGNMQWNKTYGGANSDYFQSLIITSDGGFAIVGVTHSFSPSGDVWLIKTDSFGNVEWDQRYGGSDLEFAFELIETTDGGYAIAGGTYSYSGGSNLDAFFIKTDSQGNMQWSKTYGGADADNFSSLVAASDGGYMLAGSTSSFGECNRDFWLVKIDASGNMLWSKTYGERAIDVAQSLVVASDGGYVLSGYKGFSGSGNWDCWVVKTDGSGNMQWNQTFGGPEIENTNTILVTSDGGYAIASYTGSFGAGDFDAWLIKIDSSGKVQWNQTYGKAGADIGYSVIETNDGCLAFVGYTRSLDAKCADYWLTIVDVNPFMSTYDFELTFGEIPYNVEISTNSTISDYTIDTNQSQIRFNVSGLTGTTGYCKISIPEPMLGDDFSVYLSGEPLVKDITYTVKSNGTHYIVCLKYHHSQHTITFKAVETVPEFCSLVFVPLIAVGVIFTVYAKKRLQKQRPT